MKLYKLLMVSGICTALCCSAAYAEHPHDSQIKPDANAVQTEPAKDPNAAPVFVLPDPNGKDVKLTDFKGKIVVLEWFNYDCPFVKALHGSDVVKNLVAKYDPNKVVWLAINSTHYAVAEDNKKAIEQWKLKYTVLSDADGKVGKLYGAKTTPHIFVIDTQGKIAYQGALDNAPLAKKPEKEAYINYVEKAVDELLAGKEVATRQTKPYGCSVKYPPTQKP